MPKIIGLSASEFAFKTFLDIIHYLENEKVKYYTEFEPYFEELGVVWGIHLKTQYEIEVYYLPKNDYGHLHSIIYPALEYIPNEVLELEEQLARAVADMFRIYYHNRHVELQPFTVTSVRIGHKLVVLAYDTFHNNRPRIGNWDLLETAIENFSQMEIKEW